MKKHTRVWGLLFLLMLLPAILLPVISFPAAADDPVTYTVTIKVQYGNGAPEPVSQKNEKGTNNYWIESKLPISEEQPNVFSYSQGKKVTVVWQAGKDGYKFIKWVQDDGQDVYDVYDDGCIVESLEKDYIFTAIFQPVQYNLTYQKKLLAEDLYIGPENFAVITGAATTHTYGEPVNLAEPKPADTYTFKHWKIYRASDKTWLADREKGATITATEFPYDLIIIPQWEPNSFDVVRYDGYRGSDGSFVEIGTYTGQAAYGTTVSAATFGTDTPAYRGYEFDPLTATAFDEEHPLSLQVAYYAESAETPNKIYRVYTAKTYTVHYTDCDYEPTTHTYDAGTVIQNPTRTGYTFLGWEAVVSAGDAWSETPLTDNGDGTWTLSGTAYDGNATLTLRAKWAAVTYTVTYADCEGVPESWNAPSVHTYDTDTVIQNPTRTGYTFLGWEAFVALGDHWGEAPLTENGDGTWTVVGRAYYGNDSLTLRAVWEANTYSLIFVPDNGPYPLTDEGTQGKSVVYNDGTPRIQPPVCEGFDFLGYYDGDTLYYNPDGTPVFLLWSVPDDCLLRARWRIREYPLIIRLQDPDGTDLSDCVTVKVSVNGGEAELYDPARMYSYNSTLTVSVEVREEFRGRLIARNNTAIAYARGDSTELTVGAEDQTISFVLLPTDPKPVLIALICLIALQVIAIAAILIGRSRRKRYHIYSFAFFALPAISGDARTVVILAVVALLLQAVLVFLIAKSALIRKPPKAPKKTEPKLPGKEIPDASEFFPEEFEDVPANPAGQVKRNGELIEEPEFIPSEGEGLPGDGILRERFSEATEGSEPFDEENFIEPSAKPDYSLPEE